MFKILSIDGGGIRGVIPAMLLADIERRTGKPVSELFDLVAGTSTGGIIATMLTAPDANGRVRYSAQMVKEMYIRFGSEVFHPNPLRKLVTLGGLRGSKYSAKRLDSLLQRMLGEAELCDSLAPLLIPAYDMAAPRPFFFKSTYAQSPWSTRDNPRLWQAARATSAAPTYFPPFPLHGCEKAPSMCMIDGGLFANNPALCAFAEGYGRIRREGCLLLSLGTGVHPDGYPCEEAKRWGLVQWASPLIDIVGESGPETVDYQLRTLFRTLDGRYLRIQVYLDAQSTAMDDASPENLARLETYGEDAIRRYDNLLSQFSALLLGST